MPESLSVTLDWSELTIAANVGVLRQVSSSAVRANCRATMNPWNIHIEGAAAECAVAKALKLHWNLGGKATQYTGDVGGMEVKCTAHSNGGLLVPRHNDSSRIYILVTGTAPRYEIRGFLDGEDVMRPCYWNETLKIPAYLVPQSDLHGIKFIDRPQQECQ